MINFYFCHISEVKEDVFLIKKINNISIGCIKQKDSFCLVLNVCPHAGAPICRGKIENIYNQNEKIVKAIKCPWHCWHYKLDTGYPVLDFVKGKLKIFKHSIKENEIFVHL